MDFSRPGKPTDNAFIEAFNGRFRQECLNENWFLSLEDAVEKVESWRRHYNGEGPHSALGNVSGTGISSFRASAVPGESRHHLGGKGFQVRQGFAQRNPHVRELDKQIVQVAYLPQLLDLLHHILRGTHKQGA